MLMNIVVIEVSGDRELHTCIIYIKYIYTQMTHVRSWKPNLFMRYCEIITYLAKNEPECEGD